MEIFDLYEEVNGTFYELLGVSESASTSEIRKSYRKLSLVLHPDKNKADNAEEAFRQLVAIYEVLKDTEKRKKYDDVLKNGLPDWRNPVYYYRKYRKMGMLELSIIVSLIFTVGHYLTWWVAYLEKRFEMDELLDPVRKRMQKKRAKGKVAAHEEAELNTDEMLEKELGYRKPGRWDLLPFVLCRGAVRFCKFVVSYVAETKRNYAEMKEQERILAEEAANAQEEDEEVEVAPKRVKPKVQLRDAAEFEDEVAAYVPALANQQTDGSDSEAAGLKKNEEWTDEDYAALAKSMAKFPGGTPGRWDRIAHELGRSSSNVIKTVKNLKVSYTSNLAMGGGDKLSLKTKREANVEGLQTAMDTEMKNSFVMTDSIDYTCQEEIPDDYDEGTAPPEEPEIDYSIPTKKKKVKTRPEDTTAKTETGETGEEAGESNNGKAEVEEIWTQVQQKCLEAAIKQFPKSTADRWTCIARAVPEKTKEQCMARFKVLAEMMKQKKNKEGSN